MLLLPVVFAKVPHGHLLCRCLKGRFWPKAVHDKLNRGPFTVIRNVVHRMDLPVRLFGRKPKQKTKGNLSRQGWFRLMVTLP